MGGKTEMVGVTFHPCNHPIAELDTSLLPNIFFLWSSCPLVTTYNHTPTVPHFVRRGRHSRTGRHGDWTWWLLAVPRWNICGCHVANPPPLGGGGRPVRPAWLVRRRRHCWLAGWPAGIIFQPGHNPCRCDVRDGHPKMLWIARGIGNVRWEVISRMIDGCSMNAAAE